MKISFCPVNFSCKSPENSYPKIKSLQNDCVSFTAMKKSQFSGIDLATINKFQAPIEKFNSNRDLQIWCEVKMNEIGKKRFRCRQDEIELLREEILEDWHCFFLYEEAKLSKSLALFVLYDITKNLKYENYHIPPALNREVFEQTINQITKMLEKNPKEQINFERVYNENLQKQYFDGEDGVSKYTGWVIIPSMKKDFENFEQNADKLKVLSYRNWCTKSGKAKPYLEMGDFHIYFEEGRPKIGIRFSKDEVQEIQGEKNNSKIPVKYYDEILIHTKEYDKSINAKEEIKRAQEEKQEIDNLKQKIYPRQLSDLTPKEIFELVGIEAEEHDDNTLTLSEYRQPSKKCSYTYKDLGLDENELFKNVVEIKGNADFSNSSLTNTHNLKYVSGKLNLDNSKITKLGNIEQTGSIDISSSNVVSLGHLKKINGNACFKNCENFDFGDLETIEGNADFSLTNLKDLGHIKKIKGNVNFWDAKIETLGELEEIGGDADFRFSKINSTGNLRVIKGNADFKSCKLKRLENVEKIFKDAYFGFSEIEDTGKLKYIGKDVTLNQYLNKDYFDLITKGAVYEY